MRRINLIKNSLVLVVLLFAQVSLAETKVRIQVTDNAGIPILHALVKMGEEKLIPVDSAGYFEINNEKPTTQEIQVTAMGYNAKTILWSELQLQTQVILSEKLGQLGEVVVAATRTNRSVEDLPMPVRVISNAQVRETGGMRLSDVLREQTGLQVVSDHGAGLQMQGISSDYILILLDGEPLVGRTAGTFDLDRISVSNIERIEVLRGPSSSIYGSEAMAGVINIITKKSTERRFATVESRYRSFQTADLSLEAGFNQNDWQVHAFANRFSTAGYDLNPAVLGNTQAPYTANTGQLKIGKKFNPKWEAKIYSRIYSDNSENLMLASNNGVASRLQMFSGRNEVNVNPTLIFKPSNKMLWTLRGMSSYYSTSTLSRFEEDGMVLDDQDFSQIYHRTELQGDFMVSQNQLLTFGIGHLIETVEATRYDGINRFDAGYVFLQHQWEPTERFNLVSGLRGDLHSQYGGRISPKISGLYKLTENFSWQLSVGAGFKAPDFRQILLNFNNAAAGYNVFGSERVQEGIARLEAAGLIQQVLIDTSTFGELEAEHSVAINTGFRWTVSENFLIQSNFFRNRITNLIETAPVARLLSGQNVFSYFNISNVIMQGAEIDLNYRLSPRLQMSAGYMYLDSRNLDVLERIDAGEYFKRNSQNMTTRVTRNDYGGLFNRSRHSGNFKINYNEKFTGVDIALRAIYRGPFGFGDTNGNLLLDDPSEYAPGIISYNLTLSKVLDNGISMEVGGTNLANQLNMYDPTNPGRILFAGVRIPITNLLNQIK